ncbi:MULTISPECIES: alpha-ketoglutarate-dependent dioxygenase AlkB [Nostocales]|uniref:2OG-Fe(II) oxygenase n=3 Tax=Nostocales TaxID=1161 RepID=A0A0C1N3R2_9CYAN|nr:alpha-ketoglutarate-dependent dioxygenase AlkB [Tolypothrix bouteillei]KAF3885022.1 2OG-Fe(II) oxygenase [Tolypothrix bouteillei VB521301]
MNTLNKNIFTCHDLDESHKFYTARLPDDVDLNRWQFDSLWDIHPQDFKDIKIHGRLVKMPRWQQVYGADYHYTGVTHQALPIPSLIDSIFEWSKNNIDNRLNGIVINWYDGKLYHYIGKHRDSTLNMIESVPIVTISFGEERIFRLRPWKGNGYRDFMTTHGTVFVIPYETNKTWTHEVTLSKKYQGRRISVTLRGFHVD